MGNREKAVEAVQSLLEPGEIVEVTAIGTLGPLKMGRTVAIATATAIATLGVASLMVTPKPMPIVLTNRRFLVLGWKGLISEEPDGKILTDVPRSELRAKPAKRVLLYNQVDVTDTDGNAVTRVKIPLFDGAVARRLAQALGEPPPTGATGVR